MAFCRRCGNIVEGERCRCGGLAVAPVVSFNKSHTKEQSQDAWSKTYVSRERSPVRPINHEAPATTTSLITNIASTSSSTQRFPRPFSSTYRPRSTALDSRVSAHIASISTTPSTSTRTLRSSLFSTGSQTDILPSLHSNDATLSKVYGSVLQPKETLTTHSCAICSAPFLPDTTIYPDPMSPSATHFLCRSCFLASGGSKGVCPTCFRPVLILKSEGGYVQAAGQYWHKQCFNCAGCFRNLGDNPMVDLLGRPSCAECFDTCLNKPSKSPARDIALNSASNLGGINVNSKDGKKSREGAPAIEELEHRLGISKSLDASPGVNTTAPRTSYSGGVSPKNSVLTSPTYTRNTGAAVDRLSLHRDSYHTDRFSGRSAPKANDKSPGLFSPSVGGYKFLSLPRSRSSDKLGDFLTNVSSTTSSKRTPAGPPLSDASNLAERGTLGHNKPLGDAFPLSSRGISPHTIDNPIRTSEPAKSPGVSFKQTSAPSTRQTFRLDQSALCAGCGASLFSIRDRGKFITVPGENGEEPSVYHTGCFKCVICCGDFKEGGGAQAAFVRTERGPSHPDCATPRQATIRKSRSATSIHSTPIVTPTKSPPTPTPTAVAPQSSSSRVERSSTTPIAVPFPRFGSRTSCPGCQKTVSPMEMGVVPGPQGTKWHASCLVCGGKRPTSGVLAKPREDVPGCGKRLDSAAKIDGEGGVWCRECLLLLGIGGSPQASPQRSTSPIQFGPMLSRRPTSIIGATPLVRQVNVFGSDNALLRRMTDEGTSPTKHLGVAGIARPRPKSISGVRNTTTSVNSGSRTYLVRHATGNSELTG